MKHNRNPCNESHWSIGSNIHTAAEVPKHKYWDTWIWMTSLSCCYSKQWRARHPTGHWIEVRPTSTRIPPRRFLIRSMSQTRTATLMVMKSLMIVFVVMLFCAVNSSQIITPCPKECVCEEQYFAELKGVGAKVNCSGKKLKRFPWPLPQLTTTL